ncbi:protein-export chaperone SecB [Methanimicrococcus blatticola]|uniref:Protein translocase subunit secB n=2 Tax=Methanimicrococcus blatticola TaxID=91560 RepID=A0A484F432_9EURY|nr:protein-export chaperone SecB [Methanimicrococcus blatticola]TDQ68908.1 protein translocase subunit secB [Methanimicrococcus blatticola]
MNMEEIKSPILLFNSYGIKSIDMDIIPPQLSAQAQNTEVELDAKFSKEIIKLNDKNFAVDLSVEILGNDSNSKKVIDLKICMEGYFELVGDLTEKEFENNLNINAVSILFPYLRTAVSTISILSNFSRIDIPPMNIIQWFELEK